MRFEVEQEKNLLALQAALGELENAKGVTLYPSGLSALTGAGSAIDRLVQVRVYVTDIKLWPAFNAIYAQWIGSSCPARAVVPVPELHYGLKIEVEAVALEGSA